MAETEPFGSSAETETKDANGQASYSFVQLLTYGTVAIGASWGLMEILLVTDPFRATWFKRAWIIGVAALTVAVALPVLFMRLGVSLSALASIAAIAGAAAIAVGIGQNPLANALGLSAALDGAPWARTPLIVFGVAALVVALAMIMPSNVTRSIRGHATPPVMFAAAMMGVFALLISTGRANDIERRDIALEELRQAGMLYTMESLQNSLFFMNERGLRLYREAGIQYDDVLYALGQPSAFSGTQPLLFSILDRAEEQDARIDRFLATMTSARLNPPGSDGISGTIDEAFPVYSVEGAAAPRPRGDGLRPLLSYAIERDAPNVAAALFRDGAPPLYGADIGSPPAPVFSVNDASLMANDTLSALDAHRLHTQAVLDPLLALGSDLWAADENTPASSRTAMTNPAERIDALCEVAEAMGGHEGILPLGFVRRKIAQFAKDSRVPLRPECRALLTDTPEESPIALASASTPTAVAPFESRSGYVIQTASDQTCSLSSATLSSANNRAEYFPVAQWSGAAAQRNGGTDNARFLSFRASDQEAVEEGAGVWFIGLEGEIAGEPSIGALQVRREGGADYQRAIFGSPNALQIAGWTPASAEHGAVFAASQPGHMLALFNDADEEDAFDITPRRARQDGGPIALTVGDTENDNGEYAGGVDAHTFSGPMSLGQPVLEETILLTGKPANLSFAVKTADADICLEVVTTDANGAESTVSHFVPAGAINTPVIANASPDDQVLARAYLAEPATLDEASFLIQALPPRLRCESAEKAYTAAAATTWLEGDRVDSELPPEAEVWCRVDVESPTTVALVLDDLVADIDLALYRGDGVQPGEGDQIISSTAAGDAAERIEAFTGPGTYYVRVWSLASVVSPYSLRVERVEEQGDIDDPYPPTSASEPHELGEVALSAPAIDITDVVLPGTPQHFAINVTEPMALQVTLHGMTADLDLSVSGEFGEAVGASDNIGTETDEVFAPVEPGLYYIEVIPYQLTEATPYALTISTGNASDAQVGGFEMVELGLVEPGAPLSHEGALDVNSQIAAHQFSLSEPATLVLTLTGLTVDADLFLLDASGDRLGYSELESAQDERIEGDFEPGDYVARVDLFDESATPYALEISIAE